MIWNRDGITWYSEDEVESYKQSEQEGLEIVAELEDENKKLIEGLGIANKYVNRYHAILQEIKAIAEADVHIVGDEKLYYDSIEQILDLITKAEEE